MFLIKEIRSKNGELHFQRYRIVETSWFSIYLHYIAKSDEDKHPHSHPWNFISFILSGGYDEETYKVGPAATYPNMFDKFLNRIRFMTTHNTYEYHKITLLKPTWTLVFCGERINNNWGYWTEAGHVSANRYREVKNNRDVDPYMFDRIFGNGNVGDISSDNIRRYEEACQDTSSQSI